MLAAISHKQAIFSLCLTGSVLFFAQLHSMTQEQPPVKPSITAFLYYYVDKLLGYLTPSNTQAEHALATRAPFSHPLFTTPVTKTFSDPVQLCYKPTDSNAATLSILLPSAICNLSAIFEAQPQKHIECSDLMELHCLYNMFIAAHKLKDAKVDENYIRGAYSKLLRDYKISWSTLLPEEISYLLSLQYKHKITILNQLVAIALAHFLNNKHYLPSLTTNHDLLNTIRLLLQDDKFTEEFTVYFKKCAYMPLVKFTLIPKMSHRVIGKVGEPIPAFLQRPAINHPKNAYIRIFPFIKSTGTTKALTLTVRQGMLGTEMVSFFIPFPFSFREDPTICWIWHPSGRYFISVTNFGTASLWDIEAKKQVWQLNDVKTRRFYRSTSLDFDYYDKDHYATLPVSFSPDGKLVAALLKEGRIILLNALTGEKVHTIERPSSQNPGLEIYHPDYDQFDYSNSYVNFDNTGTQLIVGSIDAVYNATSEKGLCRCDTNCIAEYDKPLNAEQLIYCLLLDTLSTVKPIELNTDQVQYFSQLQNSLPERTKKFVGATYKHILEQLGRPVVH